MKPFDCILLNMSRARDWQRGVVNRNFFITNELQRSPHIRKILSVDLLPHTFHRGLKMWAQDIRRPALNRLQTERTDDRYHLTTVAPLVSEPRFVRQLQKTIHRLGFENILLWSYLPTYVRAFQEFPAAIKVFDAVDDWSAHPAYRRITERLSRNYQIIRDRAHLIYTVSQQLRMKFSGHPRTFWVPNGVDVERFAVLRQKTARPLLVYVGIIQERVDLGLLENLARNRPQYDLQLVGPVWKGVDVSRLSRLPNVRLSGFVPSAAVPAILARARVGLVPHRQGGLVESMNPMKIYEYLAAGLRVVTTPIADFQAYEPGVLTVSPAVFIDAVDACVTAPGDPERWRRLVAGQSWSSRFTVMWQHIDEYLRGASRPDDKRIH